MGTASEVGVSGSDVLAGKSVEMEGTVRLSGCSFGWSEHALKKIIRRNKYLGLIGGLHDYW